MHPTIYKEYERICGAKTITGSVLEIGAVPSNDSLLCLKSLSKASSKIGINLDPPAEFQDFQILQGNANQMDCFETDQFDLVLCNAVLEHDRRFWLTLKEIRRVAKPGALVVIGTPGFTELDEEKQLRSRIRKMPVFGPSLERRFQWVFASTATLLVHNYPGDYYRFSPQAFREVVFEGFNDVQVKTVMIPPRVIGSGRNP